MRYNFNDSWSVIFDDNGKPLRGKIEFCEVNTTDLKPIYSVDGYELPNPIYCNERPTYQINVDEGDYTVRYYRYIGNGNMESDHSETSWLLYKTAILHNESITATHESKITTVDNVVSMMNIEGMEPGDIAHVLGYHNVDDGCPDRYFVWHSENKTSDGGIIFTSLRTTAGHWKMVIPGSYIDVRWFGDIPDESATPTQQTSNLGQRAKAAAAAREYGKDLYFPHSNKSETYGYYLFDGSNTVSIDGDIYCDNGVRFVVKDGTTGTSVTCNQLHKAEKHLFIHQTQGTDNPGRFSLVSDWVNTSWLTSNEATGNARYGYVIDELKSTLNFTNTKLKVDKATVNMSLYLDNVDIVECHKKFTNNISVNMKNMNIHTDWFADDFNYTQNLVVQGNNIVKLHNCKDANTYIDIKNKLGQYDYGDLGEQTISNKTIYPGAIIENCNGSFTFASQSGNFEFHNVTATFNGLLNSHTLNCVDCWITVPGTANVALSKLEMRRGSIISNARLQVISNVYMEGVDINAELYIPGVSDNKFTGCNVYKKITSTSLNIYHSMIYAVLESWVTSNNSFNFNVIGNTFADANGYHYVNTQAQSGAQRNYTVDGIWSNNTSSYNTKHWVQVRQYGMKISGHNYMYVNNVNPYFDKMNRTAIPFYGVLIDVEVGGAADKSRVRTDIPLIMVNKSTREVTIGGNFKFYGFSLNGNIGPERVRIFCNDNYEQVAGGGYTKNAIIFNNRYGFPTTLSNQANYNFEFHAYTLSKSTDADHKFEVGSYVGFTLNNNLDIYTHSLSLWNQDIGGKPGAVKLLQFQVEQNSDQRVDEPT